jgi:hypothetical protein
VETCAHQERLLEEDCHAVHGDWSAKHLTRRRDPSTWDLIRHGVFFPSPGFFAVLNAPIFEEARAMVEAGIERLELFDLEAVPFNQFPHFA